MRNFMTSDGRGRLKCLPEPQSGLSSAACSWRSTDKGEDSLPNKHKPGYRCVWFAKLRGRQLRARSAFGVSGWRHAKQRITGYRTCEYPRNHAASE